MIQMQTTIQNVTKRRFKTLQKQTSLKNEPVMIQMQTTVMAMPTLRSSAAVNRPQMPNEIFVVLRQGLKQTKQLN